jgi:membrane protease YdiL (CAAX protease family)
MAGLYLLSGNLLLPMVAHATGDLRALLIFWTGPEQHDAAAQAA